MNIVNDNPEAWFIQGIAHTRQGNYAEAESCFRRVLALAPESLETRLNLGYILDIQGRVREALVCYESVLKISPDNAKARYNRAAHLLRSGDLINGFTEYEFRFAAISGVDNRNYSQLRWDGSSLHGRSILVYCEQGLGDAIMFARYLPLLVAMGARVILEAQQPLVSLLSGLEGLDRVVVKTNLPPHSDFHIPLLSLPYFFQTTLDTIPLKIPYLMPSDMLVSIWKERVGKGGDGVRVGLVWAGKMHPYPNRSCPPEYLEPLLSLTGFRFYSLQVGEQERFPLSQTFLERIIDLTDMVSDFSDTAALILNLDLVITIDSAAAHLAGALGKEVWVMLSHPSDWRWMTGREDSPWYPTMRLFRQHQAGDWASVIGAVAQVLTMPVKQIVPTVEITQESNEVRFQSAIKSLAEGKYSIAINQLSAMAEQIPNDPAIWFNMGRAYESAGQLAKASECYLKALQLRPDIPAILFYLGGVRLKQRAFGEAEAYLRKAHEEMPQSIEILLQLGTVFVQQGNDAAAFKCCTKMLALNPDCLEARYNLAYMQLRSGDYLNGFNNFEARLDLDKFKIDARSYSQPRWDGSPLEGKSILVFGEQGMGDVIQFARYLPLVAELGGKIVLEVDPPLIPLFESFPGVARVLPKSLTPPLTDVYTHLLSLPHLFGTTLETVPDRVPYVIADPEKVADWHDLLLGEPVCRIGLVWRGSPNNPIDQERSCPLQMFSSLAALSGVRLFSLQVGAGTNEIPSAGMDVVNYTDRLKDFSDTAAFIACLDMVIGVDTAVTHLAGAMGKPTWVILPHVYDWRWLTGRDTSPWYPTVRAFWQESTGDWCRVMLRVKDALEEFLVGAQLRHDPVDIESTYALGCSYKESSDLSGAENCFRMIVDLDPHLPDPQHSLGVVLQLQGRHREAIEHYSAAIRIDPCFVKAHYNLSNSLLQCGRYKDAISSARATIQCDQTHADAHWLLGMLLLQSGDFRNGWREYEWRWKARNFKVKMPEFNHPQWDGSPLNGRSLLIHMEQGRGDMIQFIRFAPLVAATGGKVIVCAVEELVTLLESVAGVSQVVTQAGLLPDFDLHVPVLSLPGLLDTKVETIPSNVPYLLPDNNKIKSLRTVFPADGRLRVGLIWQGSVMHRDDQSRSCALSEFLMLGDIVEVDFYSLQIDKGTEQLLEIPDAMKVSDLSHLISDFSDTAAIIMNLDLIISVDTAVAHLAGALGKPVWTLLSFVPDWRWFLEREDSPWYPTMRLFRQKTPGNWHGVISRVRQELLWLCRPDADLLNRQGIDLMASGRVVEAEVAFAAAIANNPDNAEAYCNRGVALDALQKYEQAIDCYRIALSLKPNYVQPLFNMGNACMSLDNPDGARACYERVLQLMPNYVPAHLCLGDIAKGRRDYVSAHTCYQNALSVDPSCPDAFQGIAETYLAEEEFEKAISAYRKVLVSEPRRAGAWNMLGTAFHSLERLDEAEVCYRQALTLLPDCVTVLNNLGVELNDQGRMDEAVSVYRHLLEVDGSYADGHWNLAVALLANGNYLEGWQEFEWRFKKTGPVPDRSYVQPRWDGSPLAGKTILLHAEQGFGDTIQFARYVLLVERRGGNVILECQVPELKRLLNSLGGNPVVVAKGEPLPAFDCHLPLLSLPLVFRTTLDSIPAETPYLAPDVADVEAWRQRLAACKPFRVGLVWFAKQSQVLNRKRSCPLKMFSPLWAVPGVEFFSLQIGIGSEQLVELGVTAPVKDLSLYISDFADTAAIMANLDLVITIDTAAAHLAGALGVRTWVLLPRVAEWRWLCRRHDSPWYPTMRLFRQKVNGDWSELLSHVATKLKKISA